MSAAVVVLLASSLVQATAPAGDWWDTSYAWRQKITLTDSGSVTPAGTVVSFTVDHAALVSGGKSQADGDDIRVAYWDGANWTELSRALAAGSSWNNAATQLLLKTPAAIAASGTSDNYYLYFGNPSAAAPAVSVPTARWYKAEQLAEQSTASAGFVDVPGTTLTFTPGAASETWLIFVSGVVRSNNTAPTSVEMRLLVNGAEVDLWGHQNNNTGTPNGAGFLIPEWITGTAATQTIQPQFRSAAGTSYASAIRVVAALVPPNADLQFAETDALTQQLGTNLVLQSLTFTPSTAGDYVILGKMSQHENPGGSTVQGWLLDDAGTLHPDSPAGTGYANSRAPWQPLTTVFRRALPASSRTFSLRGTSSGPGTENSEWRYRRLMAFRTDAWEAAEYSESLAQSTTTSNTFQTKASLATAVPPAARDYLVIQSQRMSGSSITTGAQKSGELRDGGAALVRTDQRIDRDGTNTQGYHHTIGVANVKRTAAAVTYDNGYLSPGGTSVECADSTICSLRYRDAASALGADEPVPTVTWTAASQNAAEDAGSVTVTAQLSAVSAHDVTVPFTVGGTAADPADYIITASPLTITAGSTTASATISIVNDLVDEPDETAIVTMGNPTGAVKGTTTVHTATIQDNDVAGVTVTQSGGSTDVAEGGPADTYTIVLNTQPTADVVITITPDAQSNVGAGAGTARQVTFTSGNWNTPQTVSVTAADDPDIDGPQASTITHSAGSADTYYNGIAIASVTASTSDNDTAGVTITESGGSTSVTEGGATDTYTLVLHSRPAFDVTVTVAPDGHSSVGADSGIARQLTFTYANWNVAQTVTVTATDNPDIDGPHTSTITHTAASADADYNGIPGASVTASITDSDTAGVDTTESGGSTNITEGGATDTYTVVLHSRPTADVTVTVTPDAKSDAGAGAGVARQLTLTNANWNTPQTITVTAVDDAVIEGPHTSGITHTVASADTNYNGIAATGVTANITDNDIAYVNFSLAAQSAAETAGAMTVDVTLPMISTSDVTVPFTLGGTAATPAHYTITASPVTIPAGQVSATITITIIDNFTDNPDRTVVLTMGNPTNGTKGTVTVHTATILDNEAPGVAITESGGSTAVAEGGATDNYTLVLQSQPLADVTITIATDSKTTANPASVTFTDANWNVPQTITVTAVNDWVAEGMHASTISHALTSGDITYDGLATGNVTATITDNDVAGVALAASDGSTDVTEGGATDTYTVVLTSEPTAGVTITLSTDGQTTVNPATLTFTALDWNTPQTVTVTAVNDAVAEGAHTSTITHTAASADPGYNGIAVASESADITDNDAAGVTVTESGGSTTVAEGGVTDTYNVVLTSEPTAAVTITIGTDSQTTANPATLTFTAGNWSTPQTVTVTAANDAVAEGGHTSTITHTAASADPNYDGIATAGVTASITDNDAAGVIITESAGSTAATEAAATDTYTIVLNSQPAAGVTIQIATDGQTTVNPASVTFTAGNWSTPRTITVTAVNDAVAEGAHTSAITHTSTSVDANYDEFGVSAVTANITDNDTAGVTVTQSGGTTSVAEGGATDTYTVVLDSEPTANVTITVTTDGQTTVSPTSLTFTAGNWNTLQTVTITAVDDPDVEGPHTSTLTHAAASGDANYAGIAIAGVVASITDNDTAGVIVTASGGSTNVTEAGATDTYTVVLNSRPAADVTVTVTPDAQSNVGAGPGVARQLTFTYATWNAPQTVTVAAVNDAVAEGGHTSTITHAAASADPNYSGIAVVGVTASITDNDTAGVIVTQSGGATSAAEGGATDTYTVVLNSQPTADVTIAMSTDGQTTTNPTSLTFTAGNWNTLQTVTITATDDPDVEGPHTSTITHTAGSADAFYNNIAIAGITASITDNDTAGVTITESGGSTNVTEGSETDTYTVVLHSRPTADVTITVTPTVQSDVGAGPGIARQLTFTYANWNVAQTVTVTATNDWVAEGAHTSAITHTAASADANYSGIAVAGVTASITDNDTAGVIVTQSGGATSAAEGGATDTYTIVLNSEPTANVTITSSTDGKTMLSPTWLTFTPGNWNVPQTVTVAAVDDPDVEGPHAYTITHAAASTDPNYGGIAVANVTVSITDNDTAGVLVTEAGGSTSLTEGGATDTYTIVLRSRPASDVMITVAPDAQSNVGAGAGVARNLTFTRTNWNVPQTVTVAATDDMVAEGAHTSTITHTAGSADPNYSGIAVAGVTAGIADNDIACVNFSLAAQSALETAGSITVDVTLPMISIHDVTVPFTLGGTAATPANYTVTASPVTIPAGQFSTTITITIIDNFTNNADRTVILTMGNPTNGTKGTVTVHTATILDNEPPGVSVIESGGSTTVTEGGATDSYTLVLQSQPLADVTIAISTDNKTTANPASVTFTAGNWNLPQTITVTAVNDTVAEGGHASLISHAMASADSAYNGLTIGNVTATITDNDTAGVTITQSGGSTDITEAGATDTYTVVLTSEPTANVTISVSPDSQTTISPTSLTFTAGNWNTPQTVTVTAVDDPVAETTHTGMITHTASSGDPNYSSIPLVSLTASITDNDAAGITVTESSGSTAVVEAGLPDTYTIVLTSRPVADVTIAIATDSRTAVNPVTLTFTAGNWSTPQTVTVTAPDNALAEGLHTSTITHTTTSADPNYNGIAIADVTATITDNDVACVSFSLAAQSAIENAGPLTVNVTLSMVAADDVTVPFSLGGTASSPVDYTITPSPVTIPAGQLSTTITITINDDFINEPDETVILTMGNPTNGSKGAVTVHTITINDNEPPGVSIAESAGSTTVTEGGPADTYTMVLQSQPLADVTIAIGTDGQTTVNPVSVTFTAGNWNVPQTIAVTALNDALAEGMHASAISHTPASADNTYNSLTIGNVTATIADNDTAGVTITQSGGSTNVTEGAETDSYSVVLTSEPTATVTISVNMDGKTTASPTSLTFTAGDWNTPQTVTVTAVDDAAAEGPHASSIGHTAASADVNYSGLAAPDLTANVTDNDAAGVTVTESGGSTSVVEPGATDTYTIVLNSQPVADVTISVTTDNKIAANPATLTFTAGNWNTPQTVTVAAVDDAVAEGLHTSTITHTAASTDSAYGSISVAGVAVAVTDNDTAGITVSPTSGLITAETGATATFTIVLDSQPTADVTIGLNSNDPAEGTVSPAGLTFTSLNWSTPQTVTVHGVDDLLQDGSVTYTIVTAAGVSADPNYNTLDSPNVSAINQDNDTAGITVLPAAGLVTTEAGATAAFTIALNSQPTTDVTIGLSSSNPAEGTVSPATLTFTALNWNTPQTVTVNGVDDLLQDGSATYTIVTAAGISADPQYNGMDPADVSVTNQDNDTAGITILPTAGLVTTEAGATAAFTIALNSQPAAGVTIGLSSSNPAEGSVSPATLTFTALNWSMPQTVTVRGMDDSVQDGSVAYTVQTAAAVSADPDYSGIDPADIAVTNHDNDTAGITVSPAGELVIDEPGGSAIFTIALNSQPAADVTIGLSTSDPAEATLSPSSITFTASNWNVPQTVTVTRLDEHAIEGTASFAIIMAPAISTDPQYSGAATPEVPVTNERSSDDITVEIHRLTRYGVCGPIGYVPLLVGIQGLLGMKVHRRGRFRTAALPRTQSKKR